MNDPDQLTTSKVCTKPLREQINVVAEYHAHRISPPRIAYRTGIDPALVEALIKGEAYQALFKARLALHRKVRRDQRLQKSLRYKGITQANLQERIEQEYEQTLGER